jgi:hypothetical protein
MTSKKPQPPKKTTPKKAAAEKSAPARKRPARKTAARKVAAKKAPVKKVTPPAAKKGSTKRLDTKASDDAMKAVTDLVGEANRAMGRPTKYRDEFIPQMIAYFDIETERTEQRAVRNKQGEVILDKDGQPVMESFVVVNKFPTLERFAAKLGVSRLTLANWAEAKGKDGAPLHPEFLYTYTRAKDLQAALLQEGGLAGVYEARIAQFGLKNLAGWKDQIEQTIISEVPTATKEQLDAIYEAKMAESNRQRAAVLAATTGGGDD